MVANKQFSWLFSGCIELRNTSSELEVWLPYDVIPKQSYYWTTFGTLNKLPPKITTRLQEKERVLWKMELQRSCNIQGYKSWSAAQGHTDPLFLCLGLVIKKTGEKHLSNIQVLKEQCQLHWHGNSHCTLNATTAQRGGKEFIGQLAFQNAPHMKTVTAAVF